MQMKMQMQMQLQPQRVINDGSVPSDLSVNSQ